MANDFLGANHLRLCPAIVFHYFNETAITQTLGDGIFTALDLVTLPLPIPTKINAVGRTLAQLDKASSAVSIAATLGQGTESLPNSVKQILNLTSAALGVASLSGEAANALTKWQKAMQVADNGRPPIEALYKPQIQNLEDGEDLSIFNDLVNTINGTSSSSINQIPVDTRVALAEMIKNHGRKFEDDMNQNTIDRVVAKLLQDLPTDLIKMQWTEVKPLLNGLPDADWISFLDRLENHRKIYFRQRPDRSGYDLFYLQADGTPDGVSIATIDNAGNINLKDNIADEVFDASEMSEVTTERALYCRGGTCEMVNGACFIAGTLVHTKNGLVPIEDIEVQDQVWAYHTETNQPMLSKVLHRFKKTWHRFRQIITSRDTILATNKHPFYIPALQRYVPADSLRKGMQVLSLAGTLLTVQAATTVDTVATVYNFEVADQHNYYVGKDGVLVHNDYWSCHFKGVGINQGLLLEAGIVDDETLKIFEKDILASSKLRKFLKQASEEDDLVLRMKIWDLLKGFPKIRVNFNILSGIAKNSFLFTFFKNNPNEVNSFFDIYSAAWQSYDLLSLSHQGRMNDLRARFFAEVTDNQSYLQFKTHFTVSRDSEYFRGIIRQSLNDNEITKTRNLAWGNISYRDPNTDLMENIHFIAISGKPVTTALMEQGIENIDGNLLIPNPPRRNHPERMVKDYIDEVQNRSQDSEVSILDYFMRKLLDETGFDWRKPSDRTSILTEFEISLELKSTMSPCLESCHRILEDDFSGSGVEKNIEFGTRHNH
ncbi:MAG: HINT domain-containing protein [Saprospiraceae bacterium]|nr:HINT domain-containing protein [Saprospiraceae bacterium]